MNQSSILLQNKLTRFKNMYRIVLYDFKFKVLNFLATMDQGPMFLKIKLSMILGSVFGTFLTSILKWLSVSTLDKLATEKSFIAWIFTFIFTDTITGVWKHLKLHSFNPKQMMYGTMTKWGVSTTFAVIFHGVVFILNNGDDHSTVGDWILVVGRLSVTVFIVSSALANIYVITDGKFPPKALMDRFDKFNETLDPKELTDGQK